MHRVIFLFFCFFLFVSHGFSQIKVKIKSGMTKNSLAYATVTNISTKQVYSANKEGEADIFAIKNNVIEISYVGFYSLRFILTEKKNVEINLIQDTSILDMITVNSCKRKNTIIKNFKKQKGFDEGFNGYSWGESSSERNSYGLLIKIIQKDAYLSNFSFWLEKDRFGSDSSIYAPFLITFFGVNEFNLPAKSSLKMPIVYFPKREGKQTINLDSLNIQISDKGIYVVFQYIKDQKYQWKTRLQSVCESCLDTVKIGYGAILKGVSNSGYTSAFYNQITKTWSKTNVSEAMKFEAKLYYCN